MGRQKRKADPVEKVSPKSGPQPEEPRRPCTRAWSRQQQREQTGINRAPELVASQVSRPEPEPTNSAKRVRSQHGNRAQQPRTTERKEPLHDRREPRIADSAPKLRQRISRGRLSKKSALVKERPARTQQLQSGAAEEPRQESEIHGTQSSRVEDWLLQVESGSERVPDDSTESSPIPRPANVAIPRPANYAESTVKSTSSKNSTSLKERLRVRRVGREASPDERLKHVKQILKTELPERRLKDTQAFQAIVRDFLQQISTNPNDSCYSYLDDFSFAFDKCKSEIGYPIVNRKYFQADLKRCRAGNEALLQRTIMIHVVNQYWWNEIFDWNTEGQWSLPKDAHMESTADDTISAPKPDLAVSFTLKSLTGIDDSKPMPQDLMQCISPDGGDRCFPFLFMEAKKGAADLRDAHLANLQSASQALYNMYLWMVRAGQAKACFEQVRVFSIVLNAKDLDVRVHRISQLTNGKLSYQFDDFLSLESYTKDSACLLVRTILADYAATELHPLLKSAFDENVRQEELRILSKRKSNAMRNPPGKKSKMSQSGYPQPDQSSGLSSYSTSGDNA